MNLTAVIIAKNEENLIADCIDSISFCDEIILVDNDSDDRTAELAKKLGTIVICSSTNDFSELRNLGMENSNGKWVFYIDADERVSKELKEAIIEAVKKKDEYSAFKVLRKNFYLGKTEWPKIEKMERLFLRKRFKNWKGEIHESPVFDGEIGELDGYLLHFTHRNLNQMLGKTIIWSDTEAKLRLEANHPKMNGIRFMRVMLTGFFDSYIKQKGYKAGTAGLVESIYQSYSSFITYAKLWEMQNKPNS